MFVEQIHRGHQSLKIKENCQRKHYERKIKINSETT